MIDMKRVESIRPPRFGDHVEYVGDEGVGVYVGMIVDFEEYRDSTKDKLRLIETMPIVACSVGGRARESSFRLSTLRRVRAPA